MFFVNLWSKRRIFSDFSISNPRPPAPAVDAAGGVIIGHNS